MSTFPVLEVSGDARARGHAQGEHLRDRVRRTVDFYLDDLFSGVALDRDALVARAGVIADITTSLVPAVATEIRAIAAAAGLPEWQLFLLNGRTEILNARISECTSFYFADSAVLAQNWDWVEPLEDLMVVVAHRRDDGGRHLAFVEPGMAGKIGMNDGGLGVCLNILFAAHDLSGLPVHVLNAALLQCRDLDEARALIARAGLGKASHILVGSADGECLACEFFGDERYELAPVDGVLMHTNHCLALGAAGRTAEVANSCARFDHASARLAARSGSDAAAVQELLRDSSGDTVGINRDYRVIEGVLGGHRVGTCASIVMDLAGRRCHLKRGPGSVGDYTRLEL